MQLRISSSVEDDLPWLRKNLHITHSYNDLARVQAAVIIIKEWARVSTSNNLRKRLRVMGRRLVSAVRIVQRAFRSFIARRNAMLERFMMKWSSWWRHLLIDEVKVHKKEVVVRLRQSVQKALVECGLPTSLHHAAVVEAAALTAASSPTALATESRQVVGASSPNPNPQQQQHNVGLNNSRRNSSQDGGGGNLTATANGVDSNRSSRRNSQTPEAALLNLPGGSSPTFFNGRRRSSGWMNLGDDMAVTPAAASLSPSQAPLAGPTSSTNLDGTAVGAAASTSPSASNNNTASSAAVAVAPPMKRTSGNPNSEYHGMLPTHVTATEIIKLFESTLPTTDITVGTGVTVTPGSPQSPSLTLHMDSSSSANTLLYADVGGTAANLLEIDYFALFDTIMVLYREYVYNKTMKRREFVTLMEIVKNEGAIKGEDQNEFFGLDFEKIKRDRKAEAERRVQLLQEQFATTLKAFEPSREEIKERYLITQFCHTVRAMGVTLAGSSRFTVAFLLKAALRTKRVHRNRFASAASLPAKMMLFMYPELSKSKDPRKYLDEHSTAVVPPAPLVPPASKGFVAFGGGGGGGYESGDGGAGEAFSATFTAFDGGRETPIDGAQHGYGGDDNNDGRESEGGRSGGDESNATSTHGYNNTTPTPTNARGGSASAAAANQRNASLGANLPKKRKKASFAPSTASGNSAEVVPPTATTSLLLSYQDSNPYWRDKYTQMLNQPNWGPAALRRPTRLMWCNKLRFYFEMRNAQTFVESENLKISIQNNAAAAAIANANSSVLARRQSLAATYNHAAIARRQSIGTAGGGTGPLTLNPQNLALLGTSATPLLPISSPSTGMLPRGSSLSPANAAAAAAAAYAAKMAAATASSNNKKSTTAQKKKQQFFKKSVFDVDSETDSDDSDYAVKMEQREAEEKRRKKRFLKAMRAHNNGEVIVRRQTIVVGGGGATTMGSPAAAALRGASLTGGVTRTASSSPAANGASLSLNAVEYADSEDSAADAEDSSSFDNNSKRKQQQRQGTSHRASASASPNGTSLFPPIVSRASLSAGSCNSRGGGGRIDDDDAFGGEGRGPPSTSDGPPPPPQGFDADGGGAPPETARGESPYPRPLSAYLQGTERKLDGGRVCDVDDDEEGRTTTSANLVTDDVVVNEAEIALGTIMLKEPSNDSGKAPPEQQHRSSTAFGTSGMSRSSYEQQQRASTGGGGDGGDADGQPEYLQRPSFTSSKEMTKYLHRHAKIMGKPSIAAMKAVGKQFVQVTCKPREGRGVPQGTAFRPESPWGYNNDYNFTSPTQTQREREREEVLALQQQQQQQAGMNSSYSYSYSGSPTAQTNSSKNINRATRKKFSNTTTHPNNSFGGGGSGSPTSAAAGVGSNYASSHRHSYTYGGGSSSSPLTHPAPQLSGSVYGTAQRTSSELAKARHARIFKQTPMSSALLAQNNTMNSTTNRSSVMMSPPQRKDRSGGGRTPMATIPTTSLSLEDGDDDGHQPTIASQLSAITLGAIALPDNQQQQRQQQRPVSRGVAGVGTDYAFSAMMSYQKQQQQQQFPPVTPNGHNLLAPLLATDPQGGGGNNRRKGGGNSGPTNRRDYPINGAPPAPERMATTVGSNVLKGPPSPQTVSIITSMTVTTTPFSSSALSPPYPQQQQQGGGSVGSGGSSNVPRSHILQGALASPSKLSAQQQLQQQQQQPSPLVGGMGTETLTSTGGGSGGGAPPASSSPFKASLDIEGDKARKLYWKQMRM